ncbi:hypothetical protein LVV80_14680 [Pseudomonas sp. KCA11]|uniref:hypothetical protein n=1 Tax=Pseudomonas sp. KCA11 TaxID=2899114 RepID=UPI001F30BD41|nr:hypothetical protein [Pseudomonas sp. KCA11]MCE5993268.1 hypothetical protein [Pseudomonas sp. KCA11]
MSLVVIGLVVLQILTSGVALYLFKMSRRENNSEIRPYDQFYVGLVACAFGLSMLFVFHVFVSPEFDVSENLGQVGDFVGGLTNPVLSFIALIVLLRTTLIQTEEARKTSSIMLEQQQLMKEERFESTFYKLLERYEVAAGTYLRLTLPNDNLTHAQRMLQRLRKRRAEFDGMDLKKALPLLKPHIKSEFQLDKIKKTYARAWKVFDFIDGSGLPEDRKQYYFSVFNDAMEPSEMALLITRAFTLKKRRKKLRQYKPGRLVKFQIFACSAIGMYFGGMVKES